MSDATGRTMLSFELGSVRFNLRTAALIRRESRLLICRPVPDGLWFLPGGRVETGESSPTTLMREISEELGCSAEVGALRFVIENFFTFGARNYHELGLYFDVALTGDFPFRDDIAHRVSDAEAELEFRWVPATEASLAAYGLVPPILRPLLAAPPTGTTHLVQRD